MTISELFNCSFLRKSDFPKLLNLKRQTTYFYFKNNIFPYKHAQGLADIASKALNKKITKEQIIKWGWVKAPKKDKNANWLWIL